MIIVFCAAVGGFTVVVEFDGTGWFRRSLFFADFAAVGVSFVALDCVVF